MMVEGEEFVEGEFFRRWSLSEEDVRFELLNILINVTPGRWWRGIFPGRELFRKGWGDVRQGRFVRHFGVSEYVITF